MISKNIYLFLGVFLFNLLTANISSIESKFFHSVAFALNDTIMDTGGESIHNQPEYNYKSPAKAMFYSGILPGLGQGYLRSWKRTILFAGIEAIALGTWYHYNSMGKEHKAKYEAFANKNWSFTRWIKYYYKWNVPEDDLFTPFADFNSLGCEETGCYPDIWKEGHGISFRWNNPNAPFSGYPHEQYLPFINTNDNDFKYIYADLCNNSSYLGDKCTSEEEDILSYFEEYNIEIVKDHHFYEKIGKYDPFFAGWNDTDSIFIYKKESTGELLAMSPNRKHYRNLWEKTNEEYYKVAGFALSVVLTNHVVSMFDAFLSAKFHNNKHKVNVSVTPYYDPHNKSGVGGVKLSMRW